MGRSKNADPFLADHMVPTFKKLKLQWLLLQPSLWFIGGTQEGTGLPFLIEILAHIMSKQFVQVRWALPKALQERGHYSTAQYSI